MAENALPAGTPAESPARRADVTAAWFFVGNLAGAVCSGLVSVVLARNMSTQDFGSYSLVMAILLTSAMLFEFGVYSAAGREFVSLSVESAQRLLGAALFLYLPIGVMYVGLLVLASYPIDMYWAPGIGHILRLTAPLAALIPFRFASQELTQGLGRLRIYSVTVFVNSAIGLVAVALFIWVGPSRPSPLEAAMLNAGTTFLAFSCLPIVLSPGFERIRFWTKRLIIATRAYGFDAYAGRILSTGTYRLDVLLVATFASRSDVGFYSLASAAVMPISLLAVAFASARFRELNSLSSLPKHWVVANSLVMIGLVLTVMLFGPSFVRSVLGVRFGSVATLGVPLAIAEALRGSVALLNRFFLAHARGRTLRNVALVFTASNVIANFALIPPFGAWGAAMASVVALAVNLAAHAIAYTRLRTQLSATSVN